MKLSRIGSMQLDEFTSSFYPEKVKPMKTLFVCSANRCRSKTAHEFFKFKLKLHPELEWDSCGSRVDYVEATKQIFPDAKLLSNELIDWADQIICFEHEHGIAVRKIIPDKKNIVVWDLPDIYDYAGTDLISILNRVDFI
jgi:predicted protein tyrosine phosphatase